MSTGFVQQNGVCIRDLCSILHPSLSGARSQIFINVLHVCHVALPALPSGVSFVAKKFKVEDEGSVGNPFIGSSGAVGEFGGDPDTNFLADPYEPKSPS